jgi:hypothetical protein
MILSTGAAIHSSVHVIEVQAPYSVMDLMKYSLKVTVSRVSLNLPSSRITTTWLPMFLMETSMEDRIVNHG